MKTAVHRRSRIGSNRSLKWVLEGAWSDRQSTDELEATRYRSHHRHSRDGPHPLERLLSTASCSKPRRW